LLISILINHPVPSGDLFTIPGSSARASLISTTVPETGAYTSDAALTDSTLPKLSPFWYSVPTSGRSMKTISPNAA